MYEILASFLVKNHSLKGSWEETVKLEDILVKHGLTIIQKNFYKFPNGAYTIAIILGESHCIVHTYPEQNKVYLNLFACKEDIDVEQFTKDVGQLVHGNLKKVEWIRRDVSA